MLHGLAKYGATGVGVAVLSFLCFAQPLRAENLSFYIVAKNQSDINFLRVLEGCNSLARHHGDRCLLSGPKQKALPREQISEIEGILQSDNADGMAVSVIDSKLVVKAIKSATMPIITFDSPLLKQNAEQVVPTHIGVDDEDIGRKLAELVINDHPQGGTVCIMSDNDPNLELRVKGVRLGLSYEQTSQKLSGEQGWQELDRCPWITADDAERVRNQLAFTIATLRPDVIISVGHWPVYFPSVVEWISKHSLERLSIGRPHLYSAIGDMMPEYPKLLETGYVHGYVEIDFYRQGQLIYQTLQQQINGHKMENNVITSDVIMIHPN